MAKHPLSLPELLKQRKQLEKEIKQAAGIMLRERASEIFTKYPEVKSFGWEQYTASFCDGDPCGFGTNWAYMNAKLVDGRLENQGDTADEWERDGGRVLDPKTHEWVPPTGEQLKQRKAAAKAVNALFNSLDYDDLEKWFGDPAVVIISEKGIKVHTNVDLDD